MDDRNSLLWNMLPNSARSSTRSTTSEQGICRICVAIMSFQNADARAQFRCRHMRGTEHYHETRPLNTQSFRNTPEADIGVLNRPTSDNTRGQTPIEASQNPFRDSNLLNSLYPNGRPTTHWPNPNPLPPISRDPPNYDHVARPTHSSNIAVPGGADTSGENTRTVSPRHDHPSYINTDHADIDIPEIHVSQAEPSITGDEAFRFDHEGADGLPNYRYLENNNLFPFLPPVPGTPPAYTPSSDDSAPASPRSVGIPQEDPPQYDDALNEVVSDRSASVTNEDTPVTLDVVPEVPEAFEKNCAIFDQNSQTFILKTVIGVILHLSFYTMIILLCTPVSDSNNYQGMVIASAVCYVLVLLDAFMSRSFQCIYFMKSRRQALRFIRHLKEEKPTISFQCQCFHYRGNGRNTVIKRERTTVFDTSYWTDQSDVNLDDGHLPHYLYKVIFRKEFCFKHRQTGKRMRREYKQFDQVHRNVDKYYHSSIDMSIPQWVNYIIVSGWPSHYKNFLLGLFVVSAVLTFSWIFRIFIVFTSKKRVVRIIKRLDDES